MVVGSIRYLFAKMSCARAIDDTAVNNLKKYSTIYTWYSYAVFKSFKSSSFVVVDDVVVVVVVVAT